MRMHNPPHPGEFIRQVYLEPFALSHREVASKLGVAPSTFNRVVQGKSQISPEMAIRLSKTLGRSAESWLAMQTHYDLCQAKKKVDLRKVQQIQLPA